MRGRLEPGHKQQASGGPQLLIGLTGLPSDSAEASRRSKTQSIMAGVAAKPAPRRASSRLVAQPNGAGNVTRRLALPQNAPANSFGIVAWRRPRRLEPCGVNQLGRQRPVERVQTSNGIVQPVVHEHQKDVVSRLHNPAEARLPSEVSAYRVILNVV